MYTTQFSQKNPFTRIWRKGVFRAWQLSTQVPIKMLVSSLTELHTPRQTLGFSTISKEQPLFKSVTRQNPVFQSILTVKIVTVNMGWNTGFSSITNLYKSCSLLTLLKTNVWRGKKFKDTTLTYIPKIHTVWSYPCLFCSTKVTRVRATRRCIIGP